MTHRTYLIHVRPATGPGITARCVCDGQPTAALLGQALLGGVAGSVRVRLEQMHPYMTDAELEGYVLYKLTDALLDRIEAERQAWSEVFQLAVNEMSKTVARSVAQGVVKREADLLIRGNPGSLKPLGFLARKQRSRR